MRGGSTRTARRGIDDTTNLPTVGPRDAVAAVEAGVLAEVVRPDLMAHGARDTVARIGRLRRGVAVTPSEMRKDLAQSALRTGGRRAIGMWHVAHVSSMAASSSGLSITSRRTAACQYGSLAAFAMAAISGSLSASPNAGIMRSNARIGPPW